MKLLSSLSKQRSSRNDDKRKSSNRNWIVQMHKTSQILGYGAFGDVYLGHDDALPKKFVIKRIKLEVADQDTITMIQESFRKEIKALSKYHHPNIITLYGYNLTVNQRDQFLVYEYATEGPLDAFLRDDVGRARLSAGDRLSIMSQMTRAVHFLHTGGCKDGDVPFIVYHRDIKCANICLSEGFCPKLIDCGMAKFVHDDNGSKKTLCSTCGNVVGTEGYMCPRYAQGRFAYQPVCDVFSIGVVMVELIIGCLIGGQASINSNTYDDVYRMFVIDEDDENIVDGWRHLMGHVDQTISWDTKALAHVCKTAISCMAPLPKNRISTSDLLDELKKARIMNGDVPENDSPNDPSCGQFCFVCNTQKMCISCPKQLHSTCLECLTERIQDSFGKQLVCNFPGCVSIPYKDKDLDGHIHRVTFQQYIDKRKDQLMLESLCNYIMQLREDFASINLRLQHQQDVLQRLAQGVDRSLTALAFLASKQLLQCPSLVWIVPASVEKSNPKEWFSSKMKTKYKVVFICAHSRTPGHDPFEIEMPNGWIKKVAPWLKLSLIVLKGIVNAYGFPFPIDGLPFADQYVQLKEFLDSAIDSATSQLIYFCERMMEQGIVPSGEMNRIQKLVGEPLKLLSEKANKDKRQEIWYSKMVPVCSSSAGRDGFVKWVKKEYEKHYQVSSM